MKQYIDFGLCECKKEHKPLNCEVIQGVGAVLKLPEVLKNLNVKKPFLLSDINTYKAAGEKVESILKDADIPFSSYRFNNPRLSPDENAVGSAVMHMDNSCDALLTVGSGVLNDISKILSVMTKKPYVIVATAPSMDGYASATSSMTRDGLKISLPSRVADVIIGDTEILKNAPLHMLKSGIGDMLAKYISIGEWRIANVITGEYYCEKVANLVRTALKKCVDNADGLLLRDETAVEAVFEGLIIGGLAMSYAGVSRPASGIEHYFSHVWDMRAAEFGTPEDLHGISCGVGTFYASKIYDIIRNIKPDREKAEKYVENFDFSKYSETLREFIGSGAEPMIKAEQNDKKYDSALHKKRIEKIIENWDEILEIINTEIPTPSEMEKILNTIDAPKLCTDINLPNEVLKPTFLATKDIRDKYVASRLCFDLGIIDEIF